MHTLLLAAQVAAAFNLQCSGKEVLGSDYKDAFPFADEIRIDLTSMRWCDGSCPSTHPITGVNATEIVFQYQQPADGGMQRFVNRESGDYVFRIRDDTSALMLQSGNCVPRPFTGFPAKKF
jgi:hypothetical protein